MNTKLSITLDFSSDSDPHNYYNLKLLMGPLTFEHQDTELEKQFPTWKNAVQRSQHLHGDDQVMSLYGS